MKSRIITGATPQAEPLKPAFPTLYRSRTYGHVVLATGERAGTVIVGSDFRSVGHTYPNDDGDTWREVVADRSFERIDSPLTVEFQP
jgi:hypothetical protein